MLHHHICSLSLFVVAPVLHNGENLVYNASAALDIECATCSVLDCLTSQDTNGDTALHAAARSKAAGFARFYAKLLVNSSQIPSSSKQVLKLLNLEYIKVLCM